MGANVKAFQGIGYVYPCTHLGFIRVLTLGECLSMGALTLHSLEQTARNLRQVHRKISPKIFYSRKIFPTIPQGDTEFLI